MHAFVYINTERYKISNWLLHGNDKIQFARQINIALYINAIWICIFFSSPWYQERWCCLILFYIIRCSPQQCVTTDFKKKFSGKLNESDYKPLTSMQENSYGILFHKCLHYCEQDKRCIGFQICKVSESLFQCQTCCHWRKIFRYTYTNTSDCKYLEKVRKIRGNI